MTNIDNNSRNEKLTGETRITRAFASALRIKTAALMPYFTLGFPDIPASIDIIEAIAPYSDLLELGIPFSDPIADGPTIQRSTQQALEHGISVPACLEILSELRRRGVTVPSLFMGYYNPIIAYGEERFVRDAADAGADGLIVPDLPPEEARLLEEAALDAGMVLVRFLAPTTDPKRAKQIVATAKGFLYMVSLTGVTGARSAIRADLSEYVGRIKSQSKVPVAVGFGISTAVQAVEVSEFADGVIVGSAFINVVNEAEDPPAAAAKFAELLSKALTKG